MSASASSIDWPIDSRPAFSLGRESTGESEWSVNWVLHRKGASLPRHLMAWYASLCALAMAAVVSAQGGFAVMPLAWLQLVVVGGVLWAMSRHAADRECIELRGDRLTVEHASGSHVERVEFQPAWVRVEPVHGDRSLIELSGQGRRISVGRFVHPDQRRQLAEELRLALRRWHQGGAKPASM